MPVQRPDRGVIRHVSQVYERSVERNSLTVWMPEDRQPTILVVVSMHGDESETTVVLSEALRSIQPEALRNAVVLSANWTGTESRFNTPMNS